MSKANAGYEIGEVGWPSGHNPVSVDLDSQYSRYSAFATSCFCQYSTE